MSNRITKQEFISHRATGGNGIVFECASALTCPDCKNDLFKVFLDRFIVLALCPVCDSLRPLGLVVPMHLIVKAADGSFNTPADIQAALEVLARGEDPVFERLKNAVGHQPSSKSAATPDPEVPEAEVPPDEVGTEPGTRASTSSISASPPQHKY